MKRVSLLLSLAAASALLAGCGNEYSPQGIVKRAASHLEKDRDSQFQSLLMGAAEAKYSSQSEIDLLKSELGLYSELEISGERQTGETQTSTQDVTRTYDVQVSSGGQEVLIAGVTCRTVYGYVAKEPVDTFSNLRDRPSRPLRPPRPNFPRQIWHTLCRINSISQ